MKPPVPSPGRRFSFASNLLIPQIKTGGWTACFDSYLCPRASDDHKVSEALTSV